MKFQPRQVQAMGKIMFLALSINDLPFFSLALYFLAHLMSLEHCYPQLCLPIRMVGTVLTWKMLAGAYLLRFLLLPILKSHIF